MNGTGRDPSHGNSTAVASKNTTSTPSKATSRKAEDLTSRALRFLSTASTELLSGIAVALAACTYLVLGGIGLVLIGAFGGIILHATWENQSPLAGAIEDVRREKALDIMKRILDLRETQSTPDKDIDGNGATRSHFEGFPPEIGAALNDLVDAIIRDYVKWWYHPILPRESAFPRACRETLVKFTLAISQHLSRKRPADTFLDFLTNSSSIVIVFLSELSSALSASQGADIPVTETIYTYLSANPESSLANVLNEKQQLKKFKMIAEDILQNFLERSTYDCDPARTFLKEILGGVVLEMTLRSCSKPEWINGWIIYLLEDGEPDISQAIDAGMSSGNDMKNPFHDFDGNVGNVGLVRSPRAQVESQKRQEEKRHKKRLSKAEEAMEEAIQEAKRLSQLIAEEDAKKAEHPSNQLADAPETLISEVERNAQSLNLKASVLTLDSDSEDHGAILKPMAQAQQNAQSALESDTLQPSISSKEAATVSPPTRNAPFTSFDQIVSQPIPMALQEESPKPLKATVSLTVHNANITIHDDSTADKVKLRSRPNGDYLVQIEPASSQHAGWMIVRRYPDFETLHEVLRRIAQISGVTAFTEQHRTLPSWKEHTNASLRGELERYLRDACWYQQLAESEGMKRFLEKDQHQSSTAGSRAAFPGIGWPNPSAFETMGKGMLEVLTSAPKGAAEGSKAVGGAITGVFTNIGNLSQKKANGNSANAIIHTDSRSSPSTFSRMGSVDSANGIISGTASRRGRASEDSLRATPIVHTQPSKVPPMERRPSYNSIAEDENEHESHMSTSARSSMSGRQSATHSRDPSRAPSRRATPLSSPIQGSIDELRLPPPPSDIPDDYGSQFEDSSTAQTRTSTSTVRSQSSPGRPSLGGSRRSSLPVSCTTSQKSRKEPMPLTEQETRVAVELLFAVINELYTLSSAWNIRRTLLTAAKTFLLRPGNPSLASIQSLIQDSIIASNTSDVGIASHLRKLRENTLPTEEELKAWPPEMSTEEKEKLRIKARRLLVERGVPAALSGVMGQVATGKAMGHIFDCLQVEEVSRGLMFGLLLQGVRAVTH